MDERLFLYDCAYSRQQILDKSPEAKDFTSTDKYGQALSQYLIADSPSTEYWLKRDSSGNWYYLDYTWGHFILAKKQKEE